MDRARTPATLGTVLAARAAVRPALAVVAERGGRIPRSDFPRY